MTNALLLKELNDACIDLDERFDVNTGGCLYVAYCIAKFCDKCNIEYTVLMSMYDESEESYTPYHVAIEIDNFIINESVYDDGYILKYPSSIMKHKFLYTLYKKWLPYSSTDYKKYHNTDVHKTIKKIFETNYGSGERV